MADGEGDAGAVRAGAAFAARRLEMGLSQRELARRDVITAANLVNFEKGRTWPRDRTRARLEEAVSWPPGELARIHAGIEPRNRSAIGSPGPSTDLQSNDRGAIEPETQPAETAGVVAAAVGSAVRQVMAAADNLPSPTDPAFGEQVATVLAEVRALETIVTRAVRSSRGDSDVLRSLTLVRERYGQLMSVAASSPAATLGQRLYAVRARAALSAADVAAALNVGQDSVEAAEAEQFLPDSDRQRLEAFIRDFERE